MIELFGMTLVLGEVLAPIISAAVVIVLYHYLGSEYLGPEEAAYWNSFRRTVLSAGDSTVRKKTNFALTNPAHEGESFGSVKASKEEIAQALSDRGYVQSVLSGLKYRPTDINPNTSNQAEYESGTMVYRESKSSIVPDALALYQTHIWWFDNGDGSLDVYAHHEYSSLNPLVAWRHYRGVDQDYEKGKKLAKEDLERAGITFEK